MSNLSGRVWWIANQDRWPNSKDLNDLNPDWGDRVKKFIKILREANARVKVKSTRRPRNRAYLMHYSWMIANGKIEPSEVPQRAGVNIHYHIITHALMAVNKQATVSRRKFKLLLELNFLDKE